MIRLFKVSLSVMHMIDVVQQTWYLFDWFLMSLLNIFWHLMFKVRMAKEAVWAECEAHLEREVKNIKKDFRTRMLFLVSW